MTKETSVEGVRDMFWDLEHSAFTLIRFGVVK